MQSYDEFRRTLGRYPQSSRALLLQWVWFLGWTLNQLGESVRARSAAEADSWGRLVLGVLPNFLTAATLPAFFLSFLVLRGGSYHRQSLAATAVVAAGLIWWEFQQRRGHLVFDWYDIGATALGAAGAVALNSLIDVGLGAASLSAAADALDPAPAEAPQTSP